MKISICQRNKHLNDNNTTSDKNVSINDNQWSSLQLTDPPPPPPTHTMTLPPPNGSPSWTPPSAVRSPLRLSPRRLPSSLVNMYCILRQEPLQKTLCESILCIFSPYCTRCSLVLSTVNKQNQRSSDKWLPTSHSQSVSSVGSASPYSTSSKLPFSRPYLDTSRCCHVTGDLLRLCRAQRPT